MTQTIAPPASPAEPADTAVPVATDGAGSGNTIPTRKTIRLIVTDVDGTLLDPNQTLTPRTERALKAVLEQKIPVVLATGKTRNAAPYIWNKIGVVTYGIFLQGMATYDPKGVVIHQKTLSPQVARQVLTLGEDRGFSMILYSGERILVRVINDDIRSGTEKYHEPLPEAIGALQNVVDSLPVHKVLAIGDPRAIKAFRWQLNLVLGSEAKLMQAGVPEMLEVLPPGGGKAFALRALLRTLDIPAEEVLALGDAENDLEMIKMAGIGVAMGQAEQAIKDAADYIAPPNSEDGVAEAIERFVLPPAEPIPVQPEQQPPGEIVADVVPDTANATVPPVPVDSAAGKQAEAATPLSDAAETAKADASALPDKQDGTKSATPDPQSSTPNSPESAS